MFLYCSSFTNMGETPVSSNRRRARGAVSNPAGRYEITSREEDDDGWDIDPELPPFHTEVREERPRAAITRNASPDVPFAQSINPYRGCEHGCVYCFARPTHAYLGLSPGLDFETKLIARPGIGEVLHRELRHPGYVVSPIAMGTNTDPYQPIERDMEITRAVIEVLARHNHPLTIVTKGTLIERDIDLITPMAARGLVHVGVSVTTLDQNLSRRMEPRAPTPARRLRTIQRLSEAGIPVSMMVAPVVPGLTCHEAEALVEAGRKAGARTVHWIMLRLPMEVSQIFRDWLTEAQPDRATRVMARVRETHGGQDYDAAWGRRMRGQGTYAKLIARRFEVAIRRAGLDAPPLCLRTDLFAVPSAPGDQLTLF